MKLKHYLGMTILGLLVILLFYSELINRGAFGEQAPQQEKEQTAEFITKDMFSQEISQIDDKINNLGVKISDLEESTKELLLKRQVLDENIKLFIDNKIAEKFGPAKSDLSKTIFSALYTLLITLLVILIGSGFAIYFVVRRRLESLVKNRVNESIRLAREQLERSIDQRETEFDKKLEKATQRIERDRSLFMARLERAAGYMFWQLFTVEQAKGESTGSEESNASLNNSNNSTETTAKKLLKMAIERARRSLEYVKDLPETESEYKKAIYACKGNLVYFLAEAAGIKEFGLTKQDKNQALELARGILAVASKQNFPEDYYDLRESSGYALWQLAEEGDTVSKQKARAIIRELLDDFTIPSAWRENAQKKWTALFEG